MNDHDMDELFEQGLSGDPPSQAFRARVLRDSTAAFIHARRSYTRWRLAALGAAAVFIAAVSFLLGRCSMAPSLPPPMAVPTLADTTGTVTVPSDLVAWLDAAQLFRQLGMEDRMARAVDRANQLLPRDAIVVSDGAKPALAVDAAVEGQKKPVNPTGMQDPHLPAENMNRILAHLWEIEP